jgi:hypothetical protein
MGGLAVLLGVTTAAFVAALTLYARRAEAKEDDKKKKGKTVMPASKSDRQAAFRRAVAVAGLGDDWLRFLEQTARRESNFYTTARNPRRGKPPNRETEKSTELARRNRKLLEGLGYPVDDWGFGSGGFFGFMPTTAAIRKGRYRFPESALEAYGPDLVFDPGMSVAAQLNSSQGLMDWPNYRGSWASLNVGWGNPSKMGNRDSIKVSARKMEDRAAELGWERGWAMEAPSPIGRLSPARMVAIANAANLAYERGG